MPIISSNVTALATLSTILSTAANITTTTTLPYPPDPSSPAEPDRSGVLYLVVHFGFDMLFTVFLPALCLFALLVCCSRIAFAFLRDRLDRRFYERHGMTREQFVNRMSPHRTTVEPVAEIDEREWRLYQLATFSSLEQLPTYEDICKSGNPPSYEMTCTPVSEIPSTLASPQSEGGLPNATVHFATDIPESGTTTVPENRSITRTPSGAQSINTRLSTISETVDDRDGHSYTEEEIISRHIRVSTFANDEPPIIGSMIINTRDGRAVTFNGVIRGGTHF